MPRQLRLAAAAAFMVFAGSFFLPAAKVSVTDLPGYKAAWTVLCSPFRDPPQSLLRLFCVLIAWPANLALLAAFLLAFMGKWKAMRYPAAFGVAGQLYWLISDEGHISDYGIGYWVWLFSGIALFAISMASGARIARPAE
jgi:hypothetical protein